MTDRPGRQWIRPLRLWCGLILFAYLFTHFSNHALGLVSLRVMEAGRLWFLALWRNPIGETALFGALLAHWLLGLWLLYRRRTLAVTFAARGVRAYLSRRRAKICVSYPGGRGVVVPAGWTVLEASRWARIPHASVCGGRERCSTCRIRVGGDPALLPPPSPLEQRVLHRVGAPPNVRLACQLRPERDLAVTPLLAVTADAAAHHLGGTARHGQEREIAILFADLRGFTRLAEHKLPYDVVFFLNRYFEAVGGAIAEAGGIANQYTGDGVMALFGVEIGVNAACQQALRAAGSMVARVEEVSQSFGADLGAPLRLGIGIHVGPAVVDEMGYGETRYLTAVGDTVHVASRLESLTKEYECELVVSEQVTERAGIQAPGYPRHELTVRNREAPLRIVVVPEARRVADMAFLVEGNEGRVM
jgi:adenylate cyclase